MQTTHTISEGEKSSNLPALSLDQLKFRVSDLREICDTIDPYRPLPVDMRQKLASYGILGNLDPFTITNKLLVLLEDALEEVLKREKRSNEIE